jgi:hypothetical protein
LIINYGTASWASIIPNALAPHEVNQLTNSPINKKWRSEMAKSKSMKSNDDEGRKLATGHARKKHKTGGEPQKETGAQRGSSRRTGSSKKH